MLYSEKLKIFTAAHTYDEVSAGGARFRYILSGKEDGKTLVFLNGGMNTLEMWMDYIDGRSDPYFYRRHGCEHAENPEKEILLCAADALVYEAL